MLIKKRLSISKIFFSYMIFIATLSCIIIGIVWIYHEQQDYYKQTLKLKAQYLDAQKQQVKNTVENAIQYISYKRELTQDQLKKSIKQRVYEAFSVADNIFQNNSGKMSDKEIAKLIKQALRPVRFFDNRNYYFIDDLEGNSILFPPKPAFEGKNIMHITNKEGVQPFPEIIKLVKNNGEGYYIYNWVKYTESRIPTEKEFPKITYFKLFEPYNWFIAVGEYLDYVENDIRQEILYRVSQINIKNKEYVNIHTYDGAKLVSDGHVHHTLLNEWETVDSNDKKFIQEQKKAALADKGGFVFYDIADNSEDTPRSRVSFAMVVPEWQWIISAGTHIDEVDEVIAQKKSTLEEDVKRNITRIVFIMIGLFLMAFIIARYISFKAKSSFAIFSRFFKRAATEAINVDPNDFHFSEFSELALSANQMIESRISAESGLQKSEARFRQIAENIKEVFWIVSPDWQEVIYISPAYEEVWGQSCESLYKNPNMWMESIDKNDFERVANYLQNKTSGDLSEIIFPEYRIIRPDGTFRWIFARGFPVLNEAGEFYRIAGIAEDITEQKQSDQAIHALVESTSSVIGQDFFDNVVRRLCDWLNCEISLVGEFENKTSIKVFSMIVDGQLNHEFSYEFAGTPSEVVQKEGFCYYPENIVYFFPDDQNLVKLQANGYLGTQILSRNGQVIGILYILSRNKLVISKKTREVLNIIAARISAEMERIFIEREKDNIETKLRQAQKMEAIGTLAGGIAHDFNNILSPLVGYAEMLKEDLPEDHPFQANADTMLTSALRARGLIQQILTFSRKSDSEIKPIKPQLIIKEALKLLRSSIPKTIDINDSVDSGCGSINADPTKFHQIIMNLATNAYQAMEDIGGTLTIILKQVYINKDSVEYQDLNTGPYALLTVADTGFGIDKSIVDKVFDPYFTTKEVGKGTGLGLSVVHGIVMESGGNIHIHSKPGKGTEIQVYIPIIEEKITGKLEAEETIIGGTERILLVDDEEAVINMEQKILERLGYQVTTRTGSIEAFKAFKSNSDKFDLIITDMAMPNMNGIQLAKEIKKIKDNIPVIICSGFSDLLTDEKCQELGIEGYIMKPVLKKELAEKIRKVLDCNPNSL